MLLIGFLVLLLIAAAFSFYRIIILKNYDVVESQESILEVPEF